MVVSCYWDISISGPCLNISCPDCGFPWGSLSPSRQMQEFNLQLCHDHFLLILYISLLTILSFFDAMQICVIDSVIK